MRLTDAQCGTYRVQWEHSAGIWGLQRKEIEGGWAEEAFQTEGRQMSSLRYWRRRAQPCGFGM